MKVNRLPPNAATDTWLTPPELLGALGPFDTDPCCPQGMPWRTARRMICLPDDGLAAKWNGRVWCNPPYSGILPWVKRMAEHGNGIMLLPAKSLETVWGQTVLRTSDAVLFQKGRILFHYLNGDLSKGKWSPHMLVAYGAENVKALDTVSRGSISPGILMKKYKPRSSK